MCSCTERKIPTGKCSHLCLLLAALIVLVPVCCGNDVTGKTRVSYVLPTTLMTESLSTTLYARFSPHKVITGSLRLFNPKESCTMPMPTNITSTSSGPTLMLADRTSNCTFQQQALVASAYGLSGMIINDVNSQGNRIILMRATQKGFSFPAVSCKPSVAQRLRELSADPNISNVNVTIEPNKQQNFLPITLYTRSAIFAILCLVIVFMSTVYCQHGIRRIFFRRQNRVQLELNEQSQARFTQRAQDALQKMDIKTYKAADTLPKSTYENDDPVCAICIEEFKNNDTLRCLPCKHEFHQSCVDPWITSHGTCPLCKKNVIEEMEAMEASAATHVVQIHSHSNEGQVTPVASSLELEDVDGDGSSSHQAHGTENHSAPSARPSSAPATHSYWTPPMNVPGLPVRATNTLSSTLAVSENGQIMPL